VTTGWLTVERALETWSEGVGLLEKRVGMQPA
jgi:hypothetical protein